MRLGSLYQAELRLDLAESAARKATGLFENLDGPDSLGYAYASANLAVALADQGELARAEPLLRRALFILGKHLAESDPAIACLQSNLGMVYLRLGEFRKADPLLRSVLAKVDESDAAGRGAALAALAELSIAEGNWLEADAEIRQAYRSVAEARGADHPSLLGILRLQAAIEAHAGDLRQAAVDLRRSIELVESSSVPESPTLAVFLEDYAIVLHGLRRKGEAKAARKRAKAIKESYKN